MEETGQTQMEGDASFVWVFDSNLFAISQLYISCLCIVLITFLTTTKHKL